MSARKSDARSGCVGKAPFATWTQAARIAKRRRKNRNGDIAGAPYRCPTCRMFHLGRLKTVR